MNIVLTYADENAEKNLKERFLPSLFREGQLKGTLVICDYGLSTEFTQEFMRYGKDIRTVNYDKTMPVYSVRNRDIADALNRLHLRGTVMCIDCGDVWFQDDISRIFDLCKTKLGYCTEPEKWTEGWSAGLLEQVKSEMKDLLKSELKDHFVIGSGMLCGPVSLVSKLTKKTHEFIERTPEFFGVDQLMLNYLIRLLENIYEERSDFIELDCTWDYSLIKREGQFVIQDSKIYRKLTGQLELTELVRVVHNSGGNDAVRLLK
jgi:hypothetical protein